MTTTQTTDDAGNALDDGSDTEVYVLGGGRVGESIAGRLREAGEAVVLLDRSIEPSDVPGRRLDPTDVKALEEAGLGPASTVVVATDSDSRNLLVAQLVRVRFDVDRVLVVANDPDKVAVLGDAGHEPICATSTLASAVVDYL